MRYPLLALIIVTNVSILTDIGCKETSIGQPCQFSWPENDNGGAKPCNSLPQCHPLLQSPTGTVPADACPLDCVESPTIQCDDLFCVATQVPDESQVINGQCSLESNPNDPQCPLTLSGCMGYCTKKCDSNDDCPDGYSCSAIAPYTGLPCSESDKNNGYKNCTDGCIEYNMPIPTAPPGTNCLGADKTNCCPSDAKTCDNVIYEKCCYCICSKFCPIINTKICRKETYDQAMFLNGKLSDDAFSKLNKCFQGTSQ